MGVSTSRKPCMSRKRRTKLMILVRVTKMSRVAAREIGHGHVMHGRRRRRPATSEGWVGGWVWVAAVAGVVDGGGGRAGGGGQCAPCCPPPTTTTSTGTRTGIGLPDHRPARTHARLVHMPRTGVEDEVQVALAVARLLVDQTCARLGLGLGSGLGRAAVAAAHGQPRCAAGSMMQAV
jgi:hypothetical protein